MDVVYALRDEVQELKQVIFQEFLRMSMNHNKTDL